MKRHRNIKHWFVFSFLIACFGVNGQITQFRKEMLDSLTPGKLYGVGTLTFSLNKNNESNFFMISDAGLMYASKQHTYEYLGSLNYNTTNTISGSNRFYSMVRAGLWRQNRKENQNHVIYPEPFFFFQWDESRGLSQRWQYGINAVYASRNVLSKINWNTGLGLLYEREDWRVISRDWYPQFDTLPQPVKDMIKRVFKIDDRGHLQRANLRMNIYANIFVGLNNIDLNLFAGMQLPFVPPYNNLPDIPSYIYPTKRFPRITIDAALQVKISKITSLVTRFYLQADKGQLTSYVPSLVYTISQGASVRF